MRTRKSNFFIAIILGVFFLGSVKSAFAEYKKTNHSGECIILLHGLVRTSGSMEKIEEKLLSQNYQTVNHDYPSREFTVAELAENEIPKALKKCHPCPSKKIHFVTHSLGGILIRYYLEKNEIKNLGRVVMLSPPNQGTEIVDELADVPGFELLNGPAGNELGTDPESVPFNLGPVDYEVGVITGNESVNLILSQIIPGEDDGKVSVENAKLEGMKDFLVVPHSHTFIMQSDNVIDQISFFLEKGFFDHTKIDP